MIESSLRMPPISNILGLLLMGVGVIGVGYVSYMFVFWGGELPSFSTAAKHQILNEPVIGGFGEILEEDQDDESEIADVIAVTTVKDDAVLVKENVDTVDDDVKEKPIKELATLDIERSSGSTLGAVNLRNDVIYLTVPKLQIYDAVVEISVDGSDEYIYDTVLTQALAHLNGSAMPGEFGNPFIFGHSKLPIFASNDYESMFTNLPKMRIGDVIDVAYQGTTYRYQISQTGVVEPNDVFVMHQPQTKKMLTLMTCIPPGFANQRYITVSELIDVL